MAIDVESQEPVDVEEMDLVEDDEPFTPGWGRRVLVIALGTLLAGAVLAIILLTWARGSWWYSYDADRPLDRASRTHLAALRDELQSGGAASGVVELLDVALDPATHPSDVRVYLIEAYETLEATGDPELVAAADDLQAMIRMIRAEALTPYLVPTLQWP